MRLPKKFLRAGSPGHSAVHALGALALSAATVSAQTAPLTRVSGAALTLPDHIKFDKKFVPAGLAGDTVNVMVELADEPAVSVYSDARNTHHFSEATARAMSEAHAQTLVSKQRTVRKLLKAPDIGAKVVFSVRHAFNGISVNVSRENIERIAALPGVKSVHVQRPKQQFANNSAFFINTPSFWNTVANGGLGGLHGEGIKVGVIDSGIDYIHTTFGGSGSAADYQTNLALTTTAPNQFFPNKIVAGGYDLAGDAYTAAASGVGSVPAPDPNPFDAPSTAGTTVGHGTSCASIVAGRGTTSAGTTYTGTFDSSTPIPSELVGPGMAPQATLYSYRVFGNTGSTNLVTQGVDRALQDGMNVISLSLGADQGDGSDSDAIALDNASKAGVVCVAAAGNAGDTYYETGTPAASVRDISVAASYNSNYQFTLVKGVAPTALATALTPGATFSPGTNGTPPANFPTQDVVYALPHIGLAQNADGTFPNLTNAAAIKGHIALIDRGTYSFYIKVAECEQAGATAVIIANNQSGAISPLTTGAATGPLAPNGTYTPSIPNGAISQADGNTIKTYLDGTNGTDTGVQVALGIVPGTDTMPGYTSRGPRRPDGLLKPDLSAPAEAVDAANHNTGTGADAFNGTSSATPHVAGSMALLKQLHPSWTVEELKALLMNTSSHDLYANPGLSGVKFGPGRVGNGRIDLSPASLSNVVAYNADGSGVVSVSFGSVDVPVTGTSTFTRTVTVSNKGTTTQAFTTGVTSIGTDVPGVTFTATPATVSVAAGTTTPVTITMTAVGSQMRHSHDPSIALSQSGVTRDWNSEATGYLTLTPTTSGTTQPPLRLTLYALPRPASTVAATSPRLTLPGATGTVGITFAGTGINTGTNYPSAGGTDILSFLKVMELQYTGTGALNDGTYDDSANLQYVGVTSDYVAEGNSLANTVYHFGIVSYKNHAAPDAFNTEFDINIDTTGSTTFAPNYSIYNFLAGASQAYSNVYLPTIIKLATSTTASSSAAGVYRLDGLSGSYDTNIFNTNVLTYPIKGSALGFTAASTTGRIRYQISGFYNGVLVSQTPILTYDPTAPGLLETSAGKEPTLDADAAGTVNLAYNNANLLANHSRGALAIHFHNADGARAEAISSVTPSITSYAPASGPVGTTVTLTGTGFTGTTSVLFFNQKAATFQVVSDTTITATVPAGATTGVIGITTPTGKFTAAKKFVVTAN